MELKEIEKAQQSINIPDILGELKYIETLTHEIFTPLSSIRGNHSTTNYARVEDQDKPTPPKGYTTTTMTEIRYLIQEIKINLQHTLQDLTKTAKWHTEHADIN